MKIFLRIIQEIRNLFYELRTCFAKLPEKIDYNVPYVCQFATPESAELSLTKKLFPVDDPDWRNTGAISPERYAKWAFTMCGMACTSMALKYFINDNTKIVPLAEDALIRGVYSENTKEISNMKYREFARWVKKYSLKAEIYTRLSIRGIQYALAKGKPVIVSVNPNIREYNTALVNQKGGHLVLVTGYDVSKEILLINNPSGFVSSNTQIKYSLSFNKFNNYYAGRGILLSKVGI